MKIQMIIKLNNMIHTYMSQNIYKLQLVDKVQPQIMTNRNRPKKDNYNLRADFQYLKNNNYSIIKQIDRGSYGVVYKAQDFNTHGFCAIKINFNIICREQLFIQMGLLKLMRNKQRLPLLHRIIEKKGTYSIVMDYYRSKPFITFFNKYNLIQIKHYLYQLLLGLKQLKQLGIYHRDIKPSNFLYDQATKRGVIVDFGLAQVDSNFVRQLQQKFEEYKEQGHQDCQEIQDQLKIYKNVEECLKLIGRDKIGTQIFMPPQSIFKIPGQTYSSDMWPVGIILLQFCTKRFNIFSNFPELQKYFLLQKNSYIVSFLLQLGNLFGKQNVINCCKKLGYEVIFPINLQTTHISDIITIQNVQEHKQDILDLLAKLLALDPNQRITVQQALAHNFFKDIVQQHK